MTTCEYELQSGKPSEADYTPCGKVREAFLSRAPEMILSGPADTGKTLGLLYKLHILACKHAGASIVICRKQMSDTYCTVLQTFQNKVLHEGAPVEVYGLVTQPAPISVSAVTLFDFGIDPTVYDRPDLEAPDNPVHNAVLQLDAAIEQVGAFFRDDGVIQ